jgi:hypothetical protein
MDSTEIDEGLVRSLLQEQHPDLAGLGLRRVAGGLDNQLWRLGDELACSCRARRAPRLFFAPSSSGYLSWPRAFRSRCRPRCGSVNRLHASQGRGPLRHGFPANQATLAILFVWKLKRMQQVKTMAEPVSVV